MEKIAIRIGYSMSMFDTCLLVASSACHPRNSETRCLFVGSWGWSCWRYPFLGWLSPDLEQQVTQIDIYTLENSTKLKPKNPWFVDVVRFPSRPFFKFQMLGKPGGYVLSRFPSPCSPHKSSLLLIASDHSRKPLSQHLNNEQKWVLVLVRFAACFFRPRKPFKISKDCQITKVYIYIPWIERWLKSHGNQKKTFVTSW